MYFSTFLKTIFVVSLCLLTLNIEARYHHKHKRHLMGRDLLDAIHPCNENDPCGGDSQCCAGFACIEALHVCKRQPP